MVPGVPVGDPPLAGLFSGSRSQALYQIGSSSVGAFSENRRGQLGFGQLRVQFVSPFQSSWTARLWPAQSPVRGPFSETIKVDDDLTCLL